ncbi:unnamed protein product [Owenia fusiformis]|uniref:Serine/threonine-protein phosphatase CPPED1 n=1 Tax=Owenia fusiformis TaxID=6347 RepID=A0A8J1U4N5_OWEFU|nr:unnamed protein product [Owenia fusiformis]
MIRNMADETLTSRLTKPQNRRFERFDEENEKQWQGPYCFIQGADTQFGMIDSYLDHKTEPGWEEEIRLLKIAIGNINKMKPRPRFFVVCGDLVHEFPGSPYRAAQEKDLKQVFNEIHPDIPLVCVCGNHDVGDSPTPESIQIYKNSFGDDYFAFTVGGVRYIALNSQFYQDSSQVPDLKQEQDDWLDKELALYSSARNSDKQYQHLVIFQHIPWFLKTPEEENEYFNIDITVRQKMLEKFHNAGVKTIFCGHYHRNAGGTYKNMELVVTSAVGAQLGDDRSGLRVVKVLEHSIEHDYVAVEDIPADVVL